MNYPSAIHKIITPTYTDSFDLQDAFAAEQFEWLLQWSKLFCLDLEKNNTDLEMQLHFINSQNQKLVMERDQLKEQLREENLENQELQKAIEKATYGLQFESVLKEELQIDRDGMIIQLEEQKIMFKGIVAKLEEQVRSMQVIISESQQQISQIDANRQELLKTIETQEREHMHQIKSLEDKYQESITCSICLVTWDEIGDHRVVSLPCGHLFGNSCIQQYALRHPYCPMCRIFFSTSNIRPLFGRQIVPN